MQAINDSGAIKGLDAREDGVYITYVPASGADPVTKKLGEPVTYDFTKRVSVSIGHAWNATFTISLSDIPGATKLLGLKSFSTGTINTYSQNTSNVSARCNVNEDCTEITVTVTAYAQYQTNTTVNFNASVLYV